MSAALCHLANTSYRLDRGLRFDPVREEFLNDAEANQHRSRVYRAPYVVPARYSGTYLGGIGIDGAYIYPPLPAKESAQELSAA